MSVPGLFVAHSVQVKTAGGVNAWIDQIQDADLNPGISVFEESGSGETDREYTAVQSREPVLKINTSDLGFLATCGLNGVPVVPASGSPGVTAWGKFVPNTGIRDAIATTSHLKLLMSDGLLIPLSIQGSHNRIARLMVEMHAILGSVATYSGATPFVVTKDQAITSGGQTSTVRYVPSVVKYTSGSDRLVQGIRDLSVNFGIELFKEGSDSEVDPTYIAIRSRAPSIEFTTLDGELLDDVTEGGLNCTAMAVYFQKVSENGERVAKGTGEHISITCTKGLLVPGGLNLPHNNAAEGRYRFTPVKNTNILTIATNATIPTT